MKLKNGDISDLLRFGSIYPVIFVRQGFKGDPKVKFKDGSSSYFGYLSPSNAANSTRRTLENSVRDAFFDKQRMHQKIFAKVVGLPKTGNVEGAYTFFGAAHPYVRSSKITPNICTSKAHRFIKKGSKVFYAQVVGMVESYNHRSSVTIIENIIHYFSEKGIKSEGTLFPNICLGRDDKFDHDKSIITEEILSTMKIGNYFLVKKAGFQYEGKEVLNLVINFYEKNEAVINCNKKLVTEISGYDIGDRIFSMPVLAIRTLKGYGKCAVGYIPNNECNGFGNFSYIPVFVPSRVPPSIGYPLKELMINKRQGKILIAEKVN